MITQANIIFHSHTFGAQFSHYSNIIAKLNLQKTAIRKLVKFRKTKSISINELKKLSYYTQK